MPCVDPGKPNLVNCHKWAFYIFTAILNLTIQVNTRSKTSSYYCRWFKALQCVKFSPVEKKWQGICINVSEIGGMSIHSKEHMYVNEYLKSTRAEILNTQRLTFLNVLYSDCWSRIHEGTISLRFQNSQNWGFSMDFLNHMVFYQIFLLPLLQVYCTVTNWRNCKRLREFEETEISWQSCRDDSKEENS